MEDDTKLENPAAAVSKRDSVVQSRRRGKGTVNWRQLSLSEKQPLLAIFNQHWENVRLIKNERLSFTNIYALISAGVLSLLHAVNGQAGLEFALLMFLVTFSLIALLTSLRLKAELEDCLRNIERIVVQTGLEEFMPVVDAQGAMTRYPKFRWLFPVFYSICTLGFLVLLFLRFTKAWPF